MHDISSPRYLTSFDLVVRMNEAFGNPKGDRTNIDWERLKRQVSNIAGARSPDSSRGRDEYDELLDAIEAKDIVQVRDSLADIIVFALGGFHFMGYNADEDTAEVVRAVMTRFCRTRQELVDTVEKYRLLGVEVYCGGELPRAWVKSAKNQVDNKGERYGEGKFLKSVGYETPNLVP